MNSTKGEGVVAFKAPSDVGLIPTTSIPHFLSRLLAVSFVCLMNVIVKSKDNWTRFDTTCDEGSPYYKPLLLPRKGLLNSRLYPKMCKFT